MQNPTYLHNCILNSQRIDFNSVTPEHYLVKDIDGLTPLRLAIKKRRSAGLIKKLATPDAIKEKNIHGNLPIHTALVFYSRRGILSSLYTKEISEWSNDFGETPIDLAYKTHCEKDILEISNYDKDVLSRIKYLRQNVERGSRNTIASGARCDSQLHSAAFKGNYQQVVDAFDVDYLDVKNVYGDTPGHVAIWNRRPLNIIEILVDRRFLYITNKDGDTMLHTALKRGLPKEVIDLVYDETLLNIENNDGITPYTLLEQRSLGLGTNATPVFV